ncbi:MAG: leucine--tRNA ligase [Tannerellaceae bacterium]|jgi:leucyl-tRNA synthetase|nr:leucine--tRNA ligase [Tannerellaceae bacterium]
MEYNSKEIERKWQSYWNANEVYRVKEDGAKPKYYVLDMFPYPSGAGLHVGHPLGYIASDIFSRYKRLQGFNVLHPMGYDAYGLPAEQYAIQTGQHPYVTTKKNIGRYREQLDKIGFSFDWSREVQTCDPDYYHWTQWAFIEMFNSYYCYDMQQARPIRELREAFAQVGSGGGLNVACGGRYTFTADQWKAMSGREQDEVLLDYRIAYLGDTMVNWCPALGTVLANDEVANGLSERGGHPVEQKVMRQWCLRVSAYAQRLLDGLDKIDWTESLKETQRNWIGRSEGAELRFYISGSESLFFTVFTTRADTIYGVTFMVLAPESELVSVVTKSGQSAEVDAYLAATKKKTERERIAERKVSGVFTGSYAVNPVTNEDIPIWISDYVLAGYGTGAIMAVPGHDSRDYAFAKHFGLPIIPLIEGCDISEESFDAKEGRMINSPGIGKGTEGLVLDGLEVKEAIARTKAYVVEKGLGKVKVNYRLRDAIFSRQRYWGEPFPVYYDADGLPQTLPVDKLPLELPDVDKFLPTVTGEPPLGHATAWAWDEVGGNVVDTNKVDYKTVFPLELNTMPGFAGSSAYYIRYMDPGNGRELVSPEANKYWQNVDLYLGGTEHATGHLIYSRFWNKFLFDTGVVCKDEPFEKLINQGMIQGRSNFVYRINGTQTFVSFNLKEKYEVTPLHVDVNIVDNDILDTEAFRKWNPEYKNAEFILEDGRYVCGWAVEKMSKSMFNVVNPDVVVEKFGADTLRLYEMFLGPLEQSKPWDTNGIDGVHRFLKKLWTLFYGHAGELKLTNEEPSPAELKSLHKLIKKVSHDIEHFSFNTSVSAFMICVNELTTLRCGKRAILEPLVIVIAPFAPHIAEELWHILGNNSSVCDSAWPGYDEAYLKEEVVTYAVSFNGKTRFSMDFPADASREDVEKAALENKSAEKWMDGKRPKKVIVVPGKIINIVI